MTEQEILRLLREAYCFSLSMDSVNYFACMKQAKAAIDKQPDNPALYGEWLLVSTYEALMDFEGFCRTLEHAAQLIKGRSCVLPYRAPLLWNFFHIFATCNPKQGQAEKNLKLITKATETFYRLTGGGRGSDICYRAQLAYYQGQLAQARSLAKQALEIGEKDGQKLVCLGAAEVLANISCHEKDEKLWRFAFSYIKAIGGEKQKDDCAYPKIAQVIACSLEVGLGILCNVPDWLKQGDFGIIPAEFGYEPVDDIIPAAAFPLALTTRTVFLSYSGKPAASLAVADTISAVYRIQSLTIDAYIEFIRAGCYAQLGMFDRVYAALLRGMQLIAPDGLWLIAADFVSAFGERIYEAAAQIDTSAPERIKSIGEGFWEKLNPMREDITKDAPAELSPREREVAALLILGKKNTEIAEELHISARTVSTHVENIYRKYRVNRRSQLVEAVKKHTAKPAFWTRPRQNT